MFFGIPTLRTFLLNVKFIPAHAQQWTAFQFNAIEYWQIALTWIIMVWYFSMHLIPWCLPKLIWPQLTPICIGFLENMDNSWYRYFFDRVYIFFCNICNLTLYKPEPPYLKNDFVHLCPSVRLSVTVTHTQSASLSNCFSLMSWIHFNDNWFISPIILFHFKTYVYVCYSWHFSLVYFLYIRHMHVCLTSR